MGTKLFKRRKQKTRMSDLNVGYKDYKNMTLSEISEYRRDLSIKANRRMRQLEEKGLDRPTFAYGKAKTFLETSGRKRFSTSKKSDSINEERKQVNQLEQFLNSVSSTSRGINRMYKQSYETFKNHEFIDSDGNKIKLNNLSFEQYLDLVESQNFQNMKGGSLGSGGVISLIAKGIQNGQKVDELLQMIEEEEVTNLEEGFEFINNLKKD